MPRAVFLAAGGVPEIAHRGRKVLEIATGPLEQPQVIVMGRVTYEEMAKLTPRATDEVGTRMNELPKVVFSNTLPEPLAWANTRLLRGDLAEQVRALKRQSADPLRPAPGGAS